MSVFQSNLIITLISLCSITTWNSRLEFSQPSDSHLSASARLRPTLTIWEVSAVILTTCRQLQRLVSPPFCRSRPVAPLIVAAEMLVLQCSDYRLLHGNVSLSHFQHGYRQYATGKGISSHSTSWPDNSLVFQLELRTSLYWSYLPLPVSHNDSCVNGNSISIKQAIVMI